MIYRILVDYKIYTFFVDGRMLLASPKDCGYPELERLCGASFGHLCNVMQERGLKGPKVTNRRARFYFTEVGWKQVGRYVAEQGRCDGHIVKVIRRKNPDRSQIVYRDELQLAILPAIKSRKCGKAKDA